MATLPRRRPNPSAETVYSHESVAEADAHAPVAHIEHDTNTGISNSKLAMWVFLGSECLLFGGLISTFLLYRLRRRGPVPNKIYDIHLPSISSFVLLISSLTMVMAVASIEKGNQTRMRLWLATTAILGSTFVAGQVYEFQVFVKEGMGFTTNPPPPPSTR